MASEPDSNDLERAAGWLAASLGRDRPGYVEAEAIRAEAAGEQRVADTLRWFFQVGHIGRPADLERERDEAELNGSMDRGEGMS